MSDVEGLFSSHRDQVFRYLCRVVGHADAARDLTQDVFVRAVRTPPPAAPAEGRAWLFTIARHLALNHVRDRGRRPAAAPLVDVGSPARQEQRAMLDAAFAALADLDRDVFLLREIAGLTYDEIATACAITPAAVRSRLHRARLELRAHLAGPVRDRRRAGIRLMEKRS